ncbi:fungal-specific transcription factor domain-containing protein [Armillaria novae-zelandiae]|uniref:Fungal-specific transcription factor domain-containing protein n=1 Tax=Armillaria novae-zelandiae TaxID=153914 RepID=A0AA39PKP5_9AGAR|nr:fungal-specific transcription factor domain-containing protein [Armillaria novae-zelandiae]
MPVERAQAEPSPLASQPAEFRKKDGSLSKMRSHGGNVPILPQTKLCPHCPAKFTRTTHLNRHLRTHTGERLHCCNSCSSQFTRSDLLARHKKRCNSEQDPSRRKSCVACTESKIKCDRQQPCSKCISRGKECVFLPVTPSKPTQASASPTNSQSSPALPAIPSLADLSSSLDQTLGPIEGSSSGNTVSDALQRFASSQGHDLHDPGSGLLSTPQTDEMGRNGPRSSDTGNTPDQSLYATDYIGPTPFLKSVGFFPPETSVGSSVQPAVSNVRSSPGGTSSGNIDTLQLELQHYIYFFHTAFLIQMPIVHAPTFTIDNKPALLVNAMQACGALYVKTKKAGAFIEQTLATARETLVQAFASSPKDSSETSELILAVLLLQTIGLFHQKSNQRSSSTIFHGMLVQMIRRAGLLPRNAAWEPGNIDSSNLDASWRDWAMFEMTKRLLSQSYLLDCCHAIYFATAPSYRIGEYLINLPGEDALWTAKSAEEWFTILQTASPYGSVQMRLAGPNMRRCLDSMLQGEPQLLSQPIAITPFGHFVLCHAVLRNLFDVCIESRMPVQGNTSDQAAVIKEIYTIQYALHNWLQSWLASPDVPKPGDPNSDPAFVDNALPFYWFGQISLFAYQEGLPPFEPTCPENMKVEARFRLAKQWFKHIRKFLSQSNQDATVFWDELIKVRLQAWQIEPEDSEGLLAFFNNQ